MATGVPPDQPPTWVTAPLVARPLPAQLSSLCILLEQERPSRSPRARCPGFARQQHQIEEGQCILGNEVKSELHSTPRGGGGSGGSGGTGCCGGTDNELVQHEIRPRLSSATTATSEIYEDTGPSGQRGYPWDRVCELCRLSEDCRPWSKKREQCPIAIRNAAAAVEAAASSAAVADSAAGTGARGSCCTILLGIHTMPISWRHNQKVGRSSGHVFLVFLHARRGNRHQSAGAPTRKGTVKASSWNRLF